MPLDVCERLLHLGAPRIQPPGQLLDLVIVQHPGLDPRDVHLLLHLVDHPLCVSVCARACVCVCEIFVYVGLYGF